MSIYIYISKVFEMGHHSSEKNLKWVLLHTSFSDSTCSLPFFSAVMSWSLDWVSWRSTSCLRRSRSSASASRCSSCFTFSTNCSRSCSSLLIWHSHTTDSCYAQNPHWHLSTWFTSSTWTDTYSLKWKPNMHLLLHHGQ